MHWSRRFKKVTCSGVSHIYNFLKSLFSYILTFTNVWQHPYRSSFFFINILYYSILTLQFICKQEEHFKKGIFMQKGEKKNPCHASTSKPRASCILSQPRSCSTRFYLIFLKMFLFLAYLFEEQPGPEDADTVRANQSGKSGTLQRGGRISEKPKEAFHKTPIQPVVFFCFF